MFGVTRKRRLPGQGRHLPRSMGAYSISLTPLRASDKAEKSTEESDGAHLHRLAALVPAVEVEDDHRQGREAMGVVPGTGIEPVQLAPRDFKSLVSTNFTIRALGRIIAADGLTG